MLDGDMERVSLGVLLLIVDSTRLLTGHGAINTYGAIHRRHPVAYHVLHGRGLHQRVHILCNRIKNYGTYCAVVVDGTWGIDTCVGKGGSRLAVAAIHDVIEIDMAVVNQIYEAVTVDIGKIVGGARCRGHPINTVLYGKAVHSHISLSAYGGGGSLAAGEVGE